MHNLARSSLETYHVTAKEEVSAFTSNVW
eukprot:SAG31_NODE_32252_length_358_cov_0.598456_2_plen_28_part_01